MQPSFFLHLCDFIQVPWEIKGIFCGYICVPFFKAFLINRDSDPFPGTDSEIIPAVRTDFFRPHLLRIKRSFATRTFRPKIIWDDWFVRWQLTSIRIDANVVFFLK